MFSPILNSRGIHFTELIVIMDEKQTTEPCLKSHHSWIILSLGKQRPSNLWWYKRHFYMQSYHYKHFWPYKFWNFSWAQFVTLFGRADIASTRCYLPHVFWQSDNRSNNKYWAKNYQKFAWHSFNPPLFPSASFSSFPPPPGFFLLSPLLLPLNSLLLTNPYFPFLPSPYIHP